MWVVCGLGCVVFGKFFCKSIAVFGIPISGDRKFELSVRNLYMILISDGDNTAADDYNVWWENDTYIKMLGEDFDILWWCTRMQTLLPFPRAADIWSWFLLSEWQRKDIGFLLFVILVLLMKLVSYKIQIKKYTYLNIEQKLNGSRNC